MYGNYCRDTRTKFPLETWKKLSHSKNPSNRINIQI